MSRGEKVMADEQEECRAGARVAAIFVGHLGACSLSQTGPHECLNTFLKTLVTGNRELALGNEGGSIHKKPTG